MIAVESQFIDMSESKSDQQPELPGEQVLKASEPVLGDSVSVEPAASVDAPAPVTEEQQQPGTTSSEPAEQPKQETVPSADEEVPQSVVEPVAESTSVPAESASVQPQPTDDSVEVGEPMEVEEPENEQKPIVEPSEPINEAPAVSEPASTEVVPETISETVSQNVPEPVPVTEPITEPVVESIVAPIDEHVTSTQPEPEQAAETAPVVTEPETNLPTPQEPVSSDAADNKPVEPIVPAEPVAPTEPQVNHHSVLTELAAHAENAEYAVATQPTAAPVVSSTDTTTTSVNAPVDPEAHQKADAADSTSAPGEQVPAEAAPETSGETEQAPAEHAGEKHSEVPHIDIEVDEEKNDYSNEKLAHTPPSRQISKRLGTASEGDEGSATPGVKRPHPDEDENDAANATIVEDSTKVLVDSSDVINSVAHFKRRNLGAVVYSPYKLLFTDFDHYYNSFVDVLVPRRFLNKEHEPVVGRNIWGTEVYTDDSDLVAALYHSGFLDSSEEVEGEEETNAQKLAKSDSDLTVKILLLPALQRYAGSYMGDINSRTWATQHDGTSFKIYSVAEMAAGSAETPSWDRAERVREWNQMYQNQGQLSFA